MIMGVVGGALVPLLQGVLADYWSLQASFSVALICYGYLIFYGMNGHKTSKLAQE
jgi:FHS family L-fucose permease-like MFS transporter